MNIVILLIALFLIIINLAFCNPIKEDSIFQNSTISSTKNDTIKKPKEFLPL